MANKNYNTIWKEARENQQILQAGVLCTYANIFLPDGAEVKKIWSYQKNQTDYTIIEDAMQVEMDWIESGVSIWGKLWKQTENGYYSVTPEEILGTNNLLNPISMHVGRITDAALAAMEASKSNMAVVKMLKQNPYVLYKPNKWQWVNQNDEPIPGATPNRASALLLGLAATAILSNLS